MREKDFSRIKDKCLQSTKYPAQKDSDDRFAGKYPVCQYYDIKNKRCELNGCIRNF